MLKRVLILILEALEVFFKKFKEMKEIDSEQRLQTHIFSEIEKHLPELREFMFAIPNGGLRGKICAKNLKRSGVTAGIPDIFVAIPSGGRSGLFIELKYGKNTLSEEQKVKSKQLMDIGYGFAVCYSFDDFIFALGNYLSFAFSDCHSVGNFINAFKKYFPTKK